MYGPAVRLAAQSPLFFDSPPFARALHAQRSPLEI
jgi:hypothetical protein